LVDEKHHADADTSKPQHEMRRKVL